MDASVRRPAMDSVAILRTTEPVARKRPREMYTLLTVWKPRPQHSLRAFLLSFVTEEQSDFRSKKEWKNHEKENARIPVGTFYAA